MTLNIVSSFNGVSDPDAAAYIEAVEAVDGQLLEFAVGKAINDFVLGCKADGIWDAIKASCILAGARTLSGALVPLAGTTAPTSYNFVSGDYDRKTGLKGDGSTKYLDSGRSNAADPQDNKHVSVHVTVLEGAGPFLGSRQTINGDGFTWLGPGNSLGNNSYNLNTSSSLVIARSPATGLYGISRSSASQVTVRYSQANYVQSSASSAPDAGSITIQKVDRSLASYPDSYGQSRLAFYSIGEALDLAKLDSRVTDLITAFGAAIP